MYKPEIVNFARDFAYGIESVDEMVDNLERFPNIQLTKIHVASTQPTALTERLQIIQSELDRLPTAAIFCSAGVYRSFILASKLHNAGVVRLSGANWGRQEHYDPIDRKTIQSEEEKVLGAGFAGWNKVYSLMVEEDGGLSWRGEDIDLLILALSPDGPRREHDKEHLAHVAKYLETNLPQTSRKKPVYFIWLNTTEHDLDVWFPELVQNNTIALAGTEEVNKGG